MCNLYGLTSNQRAILEQPRAARDNSGNLSPLPAIYPDTTAPVVRQGEDGGRELTTMRWGMPVPGQYGEHPVTIIRNTRSPHWRR
jgi:putative SOS response-associated peptidase YedK